MTNFITAMLEEQNRKDLAAVKTYCREQGYVEDYYNIFLPLYKKYDWEFIRDIGDIEWECICGEYRVTFLNLDRLSTMVEFNERTQKWEAI